MTRIEDAPSGLDEFGNPLWAADTQAPDATVEALAQAMDATTPQPLDANHMAVDWRTTPEKAAAILAALPGYRLVPVEEWERLERIESAARAVPDFPPEGAPSDAATAWFVVALPRLCALTARLSESHP